MLIKKHLDMLGRKVTDKITGINGVCTSVSFDLYGCITATINRGVDKDGKMQDMHWYDIARLQPEGGEPVMERPNYDFGVAAEGKHGAENKPAPSL